jgi:thiamine-monophosphate kinase
MDTLVADVHFPRGADPYLIAQRALRVNLSDLAAMGAKPRWLTLALTLPCVDETWLEGFAEGLFSVATEFDVALVGGDTTKGPLSITIQVHGEVHPQLALKRSGANCGDSIYVSGTLGDGAAGLAVLEDKLLVNGADKEFLLSRYYKPRPHLKEGMLLSGLASAAIDVSDGLLADLGHICVASGVGAQINIENIPLSPALRNNVSQDQALEWALAGGDDYRLCCTVAEGNISEFERRCDQQAVTFYPIGEVTAGNSITCLHDQQPYVPVRKGYSHF